MMKKNINQKMLSYGTMAGAFLASGQLEGQVYYTDVDPDSIIINENYEIDFDGDATIDVIVRHFTTTNGNEGVKIGVPSSHLSNQIQGDSGTYFGQTYVYPSVLSQGDTILETSANEDKWHSFQTAGANNEASLFFQFSGGAEFGNWENEDGFVGIGFKSPSGNTHYAWLELSVPTNGTSVILKSYAWKGTPNSQIIAGDITTVGISGLVLPKNSTKLFPNPAQHEEITLEVSLEESSDATIRITDMRGRILRTIQRNLFEGSNQIEINIEDIPSGAYAVHIDSDMGSAVEKLIIQH